MDENDLTSIVNKYIIDGVFARDWASDAVISLLMKAEVRTLEPVDGRLNPCKSLFICPLMMQAFRSLLTKYDTVVTERIMKRHGNVYRSKNQQKNTDRLIKTVETLTRQDDAIAMVELARIYTLLREMIDTSPRMASTILQRNTTSWPPLSYPYLLGPRGEALLQMVLIPINYKNMHWWMLVYIFDASTRQYWRLRFDSLNWDDDKYYVAQVNEDIQLINRFLRLMKIIPEETEANIYSARIDVPLQDRGFGSCGLQVLKRGLSLEHDLHTQPMSAQGLTLTNFLAWPSLKQRYGDDQVCEPLLYRCTMLAKNLRTFLSAIPNREAQRSEQQRRITKNTYGVDRESVIIIQDIKEGDR